MTLCLVSNGIANVNVPGYGICTLFSQPNPSPIPPALTQWPQATNVNAGAIANLTCSATGDAFLSYQWTFDTLPIAGATATSLVLTNVQPFQAGQYAVVITNRAGSITSFPAMLTVNGSGTLPMTNPVLSAVLSSNQVELSFQSNPGRPYTWWGSTNLASWSVLERFVSGGTSAQYGVPP